MYSGLRKVAPSAEIEVESAADREMDDMQKLNKRISELKAKVVKVAKERDIAELQEKVQHVSLECEQLKTELIGNRESLNEKTRKLEKIQERDSKRKQKEMASSTTQETKDSKRKKKKTTRSSPKKSKESKREKRQTTSSSAKEVKESERKHEETPSLSPKEVSQTSSREDKLRAVRDRCVERGRRRWRKYPRHIQKVNRTENEEQEDADAQFLTSLSKSAPTSGIEKELWDEIMHWKPQKQTTSSSTKEAKESKRKHKETPSLSPKEVLQTRPEEKACSSPKEEKTRQYNLRRRNPKRKRGQNE